MTVVARARSRRSFRAQAVQVARAQQWRVAMVVEAEPIEKWLAPVRPEELDPGESFEPDPVEDAEIEAMARHVAQDGQPRGTRWQSLSDRDREKPSLNERLGSTALSLLWWVGVPVFLAFTLPFMVRDIGPAYRAQLGHGTPGVFTATSRDCGKTCSSTGTWVADDGSKVRKGVTLATGAGAPRPGETRQAVDVGDRIAVYPRGGGWDWLLISVMLLLFTGVGCAWLYFLLRRVRER